jgi:hypothetical protein
MRLNLFQRTQVHIFALFLLLLPFAPNVRGNTLSLEEYRSRLKDSVNLLQSREGDVQSEEIATLQEWFPPEFKVATRGGETIQVDGNTIRRWIKEARSSPDGRKQLLEYLRALSEQLMWGKTELPLTTSEWQKSRARLDEVYSAREFRHLQEKKPSAWRAYLGDLLSRLMEWLREHVGSIEGVSLRWIPYAVYGVLILAGIILMVWILRSSGSLGWRWKHRGTERASVSARTPEEVDWQTLRAESEKKAREGAFREAIRAFFVSVLMEGQVRGWWVYQREATNKEHFGRVEGPEERRKALRQMIDLYEEAWYGLREPKENAFHDCKDWLRQMEAAS